MVVGLFLDGALVVAGAIGDERVAAAWDHPSVLEEQTVGALGAHLARGSWIVADYLHAGTPPAPPDFDSAAQYFAVFADTADSEMHRGIRDRGAALAAGGPHALLDTFRANLEALGPELERLPGDHAMSVIGGKVIRLGDYLVTRIVEQAVHLDDLARSIGAEPWALPAGHVELSLAVGIDIARLRRGSPAVLRAVYRRGFAEEALPAL